MFLEDESNYGKFRFSKIGCIVSENLIPNKNLSRADRHHKSSNLINKRLRPDRFSKPVRSGKKNCRLRPARKKQSWQFPGFKNDFIVPENLIPKNQP
jgi:hypothetical protein